MTEMWLMTVILATLGGRPDMVVKRLWPNVEACQSEIIYFKGAFPGSKFVSGRCVTTDKTELGVGE